MLPTNGLKKSYSAAAVAEQPASLPAEIKSVLFSEQQVREKVAELAAQICRDYKGKPLAIIGVLNGAFIFTSGELVGSSWSHSLRCCWLGTSICAGQKHCQALALRLAVSAAAVSCVNCPVLVC
jgi:hypothetical protein